MRDHLDNTLALPAMAQRVSVSGEPSALVESIRALAADERRRVMVVGSLSNVVPMPQVDRHVVCFRGGGAIRLHAEDHRGPQIDVDGSVALDEVVAASVTAGWSGMERLSGIPGTIGAGTAQNVGAYGQQLSDVVRSVRVLDLHDGATATWPATDLAPGYRRTRLRAADGCGPRWIVLRVSLQLPGGPPAPLAYPDLAAHHRAAGRRPDDPTGIRTSVLELREQKGMVVGGANWLPSAGSAYLSVPVASGRARELAAEVHGTDLAERLLRWYRPDQDAVRVPAALVMLAAGLRNGDRFGPVGLSPRHVVAMVNHGSADGQDIVLAHRAIRDHVRRWVGLELRLEPRLLGDTTRLDDRPTPRRQPAAAPSTPGWVSAADPSRS